MSGKQEALLVATSCSKPSQGRARWTLDLLAGEMVKLTEHVDLSRETVRRRLEENDVKPWRKDMWCIPQVDGAYVARMEDVLDLYAETPDPQHPVVCFDESPTQLTGEVRQPIPAQPGQPERYDCEYHRNGTANLFVFLDAHRSWREVKVTDQRTAADFAHCMRDLVDVHYPQAELIRVVMDNLSTHTAGALYETFPAPEAHRILRRLEFHYTRKHASWLNMVEIEIGVLRGQCLRGFQCCEGGGGGWRDWAVRGTHRGGHGPAGCRLRAMLRNRSASGQAAAKAMRTRVAVSVMRAAILSSRARKVANSASASGWSFGMTSRTVSMSQYAAVCSTRRT